MGNQNIGNAQLSDMTNAVKDVEVNAYNTDGAGEQKETTYINHEWSQQWGYFNDTPDLKTAITLKTIWLMGRGYTTDERTQIELDGIVGYGKDTFYDILFNMDIVCRIGENAYAQIIRNDQGVLRNLKVLDTGTIRIVVDRFGILKRYEQVAKTGNKDRKAIRTFKPSELFVLTNLRLADQIHGISDIKALEENIKADNESFVDMKKLMHHQVKPFILWKLKTDDKAKIAALVIKIDTARNLGEDMFIPDDDDTISWQIVQMPVPDAVFQWRDEIRNRFYRNVMMPQIVPGASGGSTESESKVIYTAHEQIVSHFQLQREQTIWNQLFIRIKFKPPISMAGGLQSDEAKDGNSLLPQPSDTKVNV